MAPSKFKTSFKTPYETVFFFLDYQAPRSPEKEAPKQDIRNSTSFESDRVAEHCGCDSSNSPLQRGGLLGFRVHMRV